MHSTDSSLDLGLLRAIARRRKHVWIPVVTITFALCMLYALFILPQGYKAKVSIAFPQSSPAGLLGSLIGSASANNTKYIGIVKSVRLAREVEEQAHVQEVLKLPTQGDAISTIRDGLSVDDDVR